MCTYAGVPCHWIFILNLHVDAVKNYDAQISAVCASSSCGCLCCYCRFHLLASSYLCARTAAVVDDIFLRLSTTWLILFLASSSRRGRGWTGGRSGKGCTLHKHNMSLLLSLGLKLPGKTYIWLQMRFRNRQFSIQLRCNVDKIQFPDFWHRKLRMTCVYVYLALPALMMMKNMKAEKQEDSK